jgi:predicted nucleotidyltransferase/uncharacterized protein (UPF0332 family)
MKHKHKTPPKISKKDFPTLRLAEERDIAMDFAEKVYQKFDKVVKSIILFGSTAKRTSSPGSDIDVIIIVDDASVQFDQEMVAWYREELGKIISANPYKKELHINTVKLTTWWEDLMKGDPIIINVLRYGEAMLDFGGFFNPLKILLQEGKIKPTAESIYTALQRAPMHLARSKAAELGAVEGIYWSMVDSSHALLISAKIMPPSPEHIASLLRENFVSKKLLNEKYVSWYQDIFNVHKSILHGNITDVKGQDIDDWQAKADEFIRVMAKLINDIIR